MELETNKVPVSIGIILDGNRRLAKRLMKRPWKGHEWGAKKVHQFLHWCKDLGIKYVTLYSLSVQNLNRPKIEFNYLMNLFKKEFLDVRNPDHDAHKFKARIRALGRIHLLPKDLQNAIRIAEKATEKYDNFFENFAIAYGGQEEITDAIVKISKMVSEGKIKTGQINESLIKNQLYTNGTPYPDLIIRTGGDKRLSNFLLWQGAYSELIFIDKMWPEITKKDLVNAIKEYQRRERRFGR